jgi:hypothetical protein
MTHCKACNAIMGDGVFQCLKCGQMTQGLAIFTLAAFALSVGLAVYVYYSITSFLGIPFFGL